MFGVKLALFVSPYKGQPPSSIVKSEKNNTRALSGRHEAFKEVTFSQYFLAKPLADENILQEALVHELLNKRVAYKVKFKTTQMH